MSDEANDLQSLFIDPQFERHNNFHRARAKFDADIKSVIKAGIDFVTKKNQEEISTSVSHSILIEWPFGIYSFSIHITADSEVDNIFNTLVWEIESYANHNNDSSTEQYKLTEAELTGNMASLIDWMYKIRQQIFTSRLSIAPAMEFAFEDEWLLLKAEYRSDLFGLATITYAENFARLMQLRMQDGQKLQDIFIQAAEEANPDVVITNSMFNDTVSILTYYWKYGDRLKEYYQSKIT